MNPPFFRLLGTLAFALMLSVTAVAQSQQDFDNGKLAAFATAAAEVDSLIRQWRPKINGAATPEQAAKLREQANAAFVAAIEKTKGISVAEYKQINQAARSDPKVAARIAGFYKPVRKP